MVHFVVSTPSLGFSAAAMFEAAATLDMQITQAQGVVDAVVGGTWKGDAADKFLESWQGFVTSASLTRTALMGIATKLQAAQSTYEVTEGQIVSSTQSTRVSITQPGADGKLGTADDEKVSVTLEASIEDSQSDLTELDVQIAEFNGGDAAAPVLPAVPKFVAMEGDAG